MLDLSFNEPFFKRGDFPSSVFNGSQEIQLTDPWPNNNVAPFDQRASASLSSVLFPLPSILSSILHSDVLRIPLAFYLIMDVAVGGTSGWFPDGKGDKPWLDQSISTYTLACSFLPVPSFTLTHHTHTHLHPILTPPTPTLTLHKSISLTTWI